ncbi:MAG TPA: hypothetical protein VG826_08905 [Pirellulales bacterium]|nr:hypothetical protein [Pirellulales bacterium]
MSPTATTDESNMTEAEFLEAQAADARAAIHETWNDLKGTLRDTATLEVWARRHPWLVAGTAVAGGFLIATTLMRPKEQPGHIAEAADDHPPATPRRSSNWLIETLFSLLKPVLGQLVTTLAAAAMGAVSGSMAEAAARQEQARPNAEGDAGLSGEEPVPT